MDQPPGITHVAKRPKLLLMDRKPTEEEKVEFEKYQKMIMSKLWDDAFKATIKIYEDLKMEGKLTTLLLYDACEFIERWKGRDPDPSIRTQYNWDYMFYFFDPADGTPYQAFRVNRYKEDGKMVIKMGDPIKFHLDLCWQLEKDQKFLELFREFKIYSASEWDWQTNVENSERVANNYRSYPSPLLTALEVKSCMHCAFHANASSNYIAVARKFLPQLLERDVQDQLQRDYSGFLCQMGAEYKFYEGFGDLGHLISEFSGLCLNDYTFDDFSSGEPFMKFEDPTWIKRMKERIEAFLEDLTEDLFKIPVLQSSYIEMKTKIAEEIGIITWDESMGRYVETYRDIFLQKAYLHDAKLAVESLWGCSVDQIPKS